MVTKKTVTYTGHCPKFESERAIEVDYLYTGNHFGGHEEKVKGHFDCDNAYQCEFAKKHLCPIFNDAPKNI